MRLICPNCGAQYEVADDAIPASGRDVQCSNCGHGWFQHPALAEIDEAELVEAPAMAADADATPAPVAEAALPELPAEPEPVAAMAEARDDVPAAASDPLPAAASPAQRSLDENLLAVLREEAEREVAQRRAEASRGIETQPELGIDAAVAAAAPARPAAAAPGNAAAPADYSHLSSDADLAPRVPEASVRPAARRDLLPDVEVISSTLRSSGGADDDGNPMPDLPPIRRSGGFRSGFLLSVLLAVFVVVAYVLAPRLAEQFPAARAALEAFVAGIDGLRLWIGTLVTYLNGMLEPQV